MENNEGVSLYAPLLSQHYPTVKVPNMCVMVALAMALDGSSIPRPDLNEMVDVAISLGITSPECGGISAAGCVRLALEYGIPEYGALGVEPTTEEAKDFFKKLITEKKRPVVVMTTVRLDPQGCGHAQCVIGMDKDNNLTINDSFCGISSRGKVSYSHPLGKPKWSSEATSFVSSWDEFDKAWNTIDSFVTVPDERWDPKEEISGTYNDKNWRRFWCIVHPKV
eukprot:TRINITY_DN717_c0_g1_i4.p2 TRINITY_DN717_c0_g1~~TRINITY_DN717_c0_g1_i4.p2  ORF type:complete len:223 (-),score=44.35 TRINITY_DN717_c0_g1_i4:1592-2260(-)